MLPYNNDTSPSITPPGSAPAGVKPGGHRFGAKALIAAALVVCTLAGSVFGAMVTAALMLPSAASAAPAASALSAASAASAASSGLALQSAPSAANTAGDVFQKVGPAIVEVVVTDTPTRRNSAPGGSGSGIVVDASGYILTNYHVVAQATSVQVRFSTGDERTAQVVGSDQGNDLAVLKVDLPANAVVAPLGDSDQVQVGDTAIAIGSPFGLEETVTQGIISAVHRDWHSDNGALQSDLLQTDAAINPGNSGGALLNANGEVIGITSAIESPVRGSVGVGFAVPINTAKRLLPQLEAGAQLVPAWLGIRGQALTPDLVQSQGLSVQQGVLIAEVIANSPAAAAKLQAGDVITAVDGAAITTFSQLSAQVTSHKAGDTLKLTVVRNGQESQVTATLQARPANP